MAKIRSCYGKISMMILWIRAISGSLVQQGFSLFLPVIGRIILKATKKLCSATDSSTHVVCVYTWKLNKKQYECACDQIHLLSLRRNFFYRILISLNTYWVQSILKVYICANFTVSQLISASFKAFEAMWVRMVRCEITALFEIFNCFVKHLNYWTGIQWK